MRKNERNLKVWESNKKMEERSTQMKDGTKKVYDVTIKKRTRTYEENGGK